MTPTVNHLFSEIANFQALTAAALAAANGKRRKPGVATFLAGLERNVLLLEQRLNEGTWRPGRYVEIAVSDPKPRLVSAAPFPDRVVRHALCAVIAPIFERGFIADSYANRAGYGTHRAIARYEHYRDRYRHVLRGDIYRYFPAIDQAILKADFRRRVACERTLWLMDAIVDGSNPQEPVNLYFPGDDLFTPYERRRGLPIGNLTSQWFANIYLDRLDHFVKEVLRAPYVRYADDRAPRRRTGGRKPSVQPCRTRDGGWPPEAGIQAQASNHRLRLRSRGVVVSETGKGWARPGQVRIVESNASEPLMTCRKRRDDVETRGSRYPGISLGDTCLRPRWHPA